MTPRNQHKAYVTSYSAGPRPLRAGALLVLGGLDLLMALWCNAGMNKLPRAKRIQVLNMLVEGSSMRSRVPGDPQRCWPAPPESGPAGPVEASRTRRTGATRPKPWGLRSAVVSLSE